MINRKNSIHLQDFPDVSFLDNNQELVATMDVVRLICSSALFIRDQKNLRVRLPLKTLKVIGKNAQKFSAFKEIIADEVNVKNVEFQQDFSDLAELKLQINFKKIGVKYGPKIKEITAAAKVGNWQKISEKEIAIADVNLIDDEFELKLAVKNIDENKFAIAALPSNDYLVLLDVAITKDLEDEGIARDIIRAVQQNRKDANLDVSDLINLEIFSTNSRILEVAKSFENYIKEQVLAKELIHLFGNSSSAKFQFTNQLDDGDLLIGINK
jgi:isoleucyl-tRNA synthetase